MNVSTSPASIAGVSAAEWQIRCDLAALYRLVAHHRWTDFIYTHLSARLPGPQHHFLINKYGVNFHEMRASDLVKIDVDGNIVEEERSLEQRERKRGRIHHPLRDPYGSGGPDVCRAYPYRGRYCGVGAEGRTAPVVAACLQVLRPPRLPRI